MASLTFKKFERVIQVDAPQTEVTIQDLINQIRDYEDELTNMDYAKIADAFGKQDLGGGVLVGITLVLLNDWRVQFEDRSGPDYVSVGVSGGNLVAQNQYNNNPIKPSAFTQVSVTSSSSATLQDDANLRNLKYLLETLRPEHGGFGNTLYWDPINGDDGQDGLSPSTAVATFTQAHSLCRSGLNDVIIALSEQAGIDTTTTEKITISKNSVHLRGQGPTFRIEPDSAGDVVTISGEFSSVSNVKIAPYTASGTSNAITVTNTANHARLENVLIIDPTGNGIEVQGGNFHVINKVRIEDSQINGILLTGAEETTVSNSFVDDTTLDGIKLETNCNDIRLINNEIHRSMQYGINIDSSTTMTRIYANNFIAHAELGKINDNSTSTHIQSEATVDSSAIADAVWDEAIDDHQTTGSAGKTLKDAKTKATLASLKD